MPADPEESPAIRIEPSDFDMGPLFLASRDAVIVGDPKTGRIVLWNGAAERIFGYTQNEAQGLAMEDLVPTDLKDRHRQGLAGYSGTGHGQLVDGDGIAKVPALRKDGTQIDVELTLTAIKSERLPGRYALAVMREALH